MINYWLDLIEIKEDEKINKILLEEDQSQEEEWELDL